MKKFTQLALVSSLAISANAMAMQAMDDAALSASTGQDGINIGIGISKIEIAKVLIHDNDGLNGTAANAGAIVIKGNGAGATATNGVVITAPMSGANPDTTRMLASHNLADLQIDSDAGAGSGNTAYLNIAAQVSGLDIYIGEIGVSASNAVDAASKAVRRGNDDSNYNKILSGLTLKTGITSANIQLGATPQGAMIKLDTKMLGGLEISNLGILDSAGGGQITLGKISVSDANDANANLSIAADVSVTPDGLQIASHQIAAGTDIYVQGINLGAAPAGTLGARGTARAGSIGDVEIQGLKTFYGPTAASQGSMITVSGR